MHWIGLGLRVACVLASGSTGASYAQAEKLASAQTESLYQAELPKIVIDPRLPWANEVATARVEVDVEEHRVILTLQKAAPCGERCQRVISLPIYSETVDFCHLLSAEAGDPSLLKTPIVERGPPLGPILLSGEYLLLEDFSQYRCYRQDRQYLTHLKYVVLGGSVLNPIAYESHFWGGAMVPLDGD